MQQGAAVRAAPFARFFSLRVLLIAGTVRPSLFRVLFILRAVRPSLRKGARRLAGEARGFQGRRLPCAGRAAQIVDFFFQTG